MRALFFGTPEIAVASLEALREVAEVVGVVCQPDRPSGRGMKLKPPPVKLAALKAGLEVYQPQKVRDGALRTWMAEKNADLALVIAYGRILDQAVLDTPRLGCLNLHASLLPKYRGAAPIQHVLLNGEAETGVCLMQMDAGMDTGDVLHEEKIKIIDGETTASLTNKIGILAGQVTLQQVPRFLEGQLKPCAQPHELASYAPPIQRTDSHLDFSLPAVLLQRQVQAFAPKPGATALIKYTNDGESSKGKRLKILTAQAIHRSEATELHRQSSNPAGAPGTLYVVEKRAFVIAGQNTLLEIKKAQPEGKKPQDIIELINGRLIVTGAQLLTPDDPKTLT